MERTFYKPAMKSGKDGKFCMIYIPLDAIVGLDIKDRDELKVTIEKTGNIIPKSDRFRRKAED